MQKYQNQYGDLLGLYQIYLDFQNKKLPKEFKDYLKLTNFEKVHQVRNNIS